MILKALFQHSRVTIRFRPHLYTFGLARKIAVPRGASYRHGTPSATQTNKVRVHRSAISPSILVLVVIGCGVCGYTLLYSYSNTAKSSIDTEVIEEPLADLSQSMAIAVPPGRPGNLTTEQELKLQELWKRAFKVFGVATLSAGSASVNGNDQEPLANISNTSTPEKKKKKRISLFGRKKHDKDGSSEGGDENHVNGLDGSDDKYGEMEEFQLAISKQTPEELRAAFWSMVKHDHPDGLFLRFLRARKWDVEKALAMLIATMHWRSYEAKVDEDVVYNGEAAALRDSVDADSAAIKKEGGDLMAQLRLGKSYLHGTDKEGRPVCFVRVKLHRQGEQSQASLERFTILMLETARLMLAPPVDTAAIVFDLTDFSMANMDYGPVKFMIKCFEANYPESLGVVLIHKSPWIFQGIWHIIKGWLDPVVASKIHFTKNTEEMEAFIQPSHIPTELGGSDPYSYQYLEPQPNENDLMNDAATRQKLIDERASLVKEFESVTQQWIKGGKTEDEVLKKRAELAEQLSVGYWKLDPYVRARTLYDRLGVINPGGFVKFYPEPELAASAPVPEKVQHANGPIAAGHDDDGVD